MPALKPHPKVAAASIAGAIYALAVAAAHGAGIHLNPDLAAALGPATAVAAGYLKKGPTTLVDVGLREAWPPTLISANRVSVVPPPPAGTITIAVEQAAS